MKVYSYSQKFTYIGTQKIRRLAKNPFPVHKMGPSSPLFSGSLLRCKKCRTILRGDSDADAFVLLLCENQKMLKNYPKALAAGQKIEYTYSEVINVTRTVFMKAFAFLLSAVMLVVLNATFAYAADENTTYYVEEFIEGEHISGELSETDTLTITPRLYNASFNRTQETALYRDQLTEYEAMAYDAIAAAPFGTTQFVVSGMNFPNTGRSTYFDGNRLLRAVTRDMPELFYISSFRLGYSISGDTVKSVTLIAKPYSTTFATAEEITSANEQLWAKIRAFNPKIYLNRYFLVRGIHDYLCENCDFDTVTSGGTENPRRYDAVGCLVDGRAVCQGYAEAFQIMCNYFGIPCVFMAGTGVTETSVGNHAWNAVYMDDGNWYCVDVTWDDQDTPYRDFYLVGTETVPFYFNRIPFSSSHILDAASLNLPLATAKCLAANVSHTNFGATANSVALEEEHILKRLVTDADKPIYFNGIWLSDSTATATGDTFIAPSGTDYAKESWTLCLVGDLNGDGDCTVEDYTGVVNLALSGDSSDTLRNEAADINGDGFVDVLDVRMARVLYTAVENNEEISIVL